MVNREFWKGRRVFVTGHTGFKGSWLSLWLESLGARTTGYALDPPTTPNLFEQAAIGSSMRDVRGDVRDIEHLTRALDDCRPDIVIHMAAQSVVKRGYADPVETYSSNVMGTVNVLEAIRRLGRPCTVVNVTSDKCYLNREWVWGYREDEPMGGRDPYSNSKGCAELVTTAYRESFFSPKDFTRHGVALASARAGNAIGGGDWTGDQLIPDVIRAFLAGVPCKIRSPTAVRPWQFVLEPLRGYLELAERLTAEPHAYAEGWNFGPAESDAKPVAWIADELSRAWGNGAQWILDSQHHAPEAQALKLDVSKARTRMNWHPVISLNGALAWIVEWYKGMQKGADVGELTRSQIARYEALCAATGK